MATGHTRVTVAALLEVLAYLRGVDGFGVLIPPFLQSQRGIRFHDDQGDVRLTPAWIRAADGSWAERLRGTAFTRVATALRVMEARRAEAGDHQPSSEYRASVQLRREIEEHWSGAVLGDGYVGPVIHLDVDDPVGQSRPCIYPRRGWRDQIDAFEPRPITVRDSLRLALWLRELLEGLATPSDRATRIAGSMQLMLHGSARKEFDLSIVLEAEPNIHGGPYRRFRTVADRHQVERSALWWQEFAARKLPR